MDQSQTLLNKFKLGQTIEINGCIFQIHNFVPEMDFMNLKLLPKKEGLKKRTTPPVVLRLNDILDAYKDEVLKLSAPGVTQSEEAWDDLKKGTLQALANSLPMFLDIDEEKIKNIFPDLVEENFPKGKCQERGQALVLVAMILQEIMRIKPLKLRRE